jgi:WD40 repeat protein
MRNVKVPKSLFKNAHYSLITQIKWSPHTQHLLATSSTDRTLRIWDNRDISKQEEQEEYKTNFGLKTSSFKSQKLEDWVNNFDWNYHEVGLIALCCNDQLIKAYNIRED